MLLDGRGNPMHGGWRAHPAPRRWRVYLLALVLVGVPFFVRGFVALLDPPVGLGFLAGVFLMLVVSNTLVLELPPYRFLHLATGMVAFAGFFIAGPSLLALLALSALPSAAIARWASERLSAPRIPPLGVLPSEFIVPGLGVGIALGAVDFFSRPMGLYYPFRPTDALAEVFFLALLALVFGAFMVLCEIGVVLRFGIARVYGTRRARADLMVYLLAVFLGAPVVSSIVHAYGPEPARELLALGWMLWGFGLFTIAAILVLRGLRIVELGRVAARQERLAALGRLASVIAHQTRHHLGVLSMSAYVLSETLEKENLSETARMAADRELEAIARTRDELDRLLAQELADGKRDESFGLQQLVCECGADLDPVRRSRGVELGYAGGEQAVRGDRIRLKQAVTNVLRNAIEASPPGGTVKIEIRAEGGDVCLRITDEGSGLSERAQGHLFEPLFTEKSDGLGMGLYVAQNIVDAHGGSVSLRNAERGAEAEIRLAQAS